MMGLSAIYNKMPTFIQNCFISAYGYLREKRRFGGEFKEYFKLVQKYEFADNAKILELQKIKLKELLLSASYSHYYKNLFAQNSVDVKRDDPFDVLQRMPILEKLNLRGNEADFYTKGAKNALIFHTSGSTGTPLNIRMFKSDLQLRMAILERQKCRFGVNHKSRHLSFVGKKITSSHSSSFWQYNIFGHQLVMSVYDLSDKNKEKYLKKIKEYNPEVVEGYPSAIGIIANWLLEKEVRLSTKCVFVTAETLTESQRTLIEKGFGCPVVNYYGSNEGATMITQCEKGNLHVDMESGIIEFINNMGKSAAPGEIANMIITSFTTRAMPLIRYKIEDLAVVSEDKCTCGRCSPVVSEIIGRIDDVFFTQEKGYVGRLSTSLKLLPSTVRRAQIHQNTPTDFLLLLESDYELTSGQLNTIIADLHDKLGHVQINVKYTSTILCTMNGKFRTQINHCK